ncbi:ABC transporter permease [Paraflavitalea soli]|uniref:ABC transporter permease n=1 Tax=Paraflavitalea soli TaxID=2315862 RepID=A0A3B7MGT9_9BACT|nr:FtsX-like permease family protein [Paraflavitalea soli]AXY73408.1 ABC transporter permease [Paraflavitalea soli]
MLKNYFKIAWRSLTRNRVSSFINISGLAVGLAISILAMICILDMTSYDKFHTHLPNIHALIVTNKLSGDISAGKSVPGPLAEVLRTNLAEVKYVSRYGNGGQGLFNVGEKSLYEKTVYVEPDYFRMMTFPAISGDPVKALEQSGSIVITEKIAKKLFGKEDPMGKLIRYNNQYALQVGAVIRDLPANSSEHFDVIIPFVQYEYENRSWINKWDNSAIATWMELKPGINLTTFNTKLDKLYKEKTGNENSGLFAYPFSKMWLYGEFKNGKPAGGRIYAVMLMGAVGLFVLLIACINFMNLSTARSEHRAREVGVRKVMGAFRKQVIFQFLCEAMLLTFVSLLLGIFLAVIALPALNHYTGKDMTLDLSNWQIWLSLLGMVLFTGLVAGSYPAFFLSSFKPVLVLKGVITNRKGGSLLRKGLVTFQFVVSIFLILATIVIFKQSKHAENRPIGYEAENLVEIPLRGDMGPKFQLLKNELSQIPGVVSISGGTNNLINFGGAVDGIDWPGKTADQRFYMTVTDVQYDWVKTAGLKMAEGRDFSPAFGTDTSGCLINQAAALKMGLKSPIVGTRLSGSPVIGVVQDFVFNSPMAKPGPMLIKLNRGGMNHLFLRFRNDDDWRKTMAQVELAVKKVSPGSPFEYHFTAEVLQQRLEGMRYTSQLTNIIGILAIFISCLGLFGLSAFLAERRNKEIGVRKVLGASVSQVWITLSKDFLKPVLIAFLVAAPLGGWVLNMMLQNWDYRISLSWWMFAVAGLLALVIAVATVSFHGFKAALTSPVKSLRTE